MAKEKARFIMKIAPGSANMFSNTMILVDRETGVNYLFFQSAGAGGADAPPRPGGQAYHYNDIRRGMT